MNYERAKKAFEEYLDGYDRKDEKVKLKIVHTYGVVHCSEKIAEGLKLSSQDMELARIIALLHDIGRFEQIKRFDSFEPSSMDHAAYGVQILFEEGMIEKFVEDRRWDSIIREAIARHSDFALELQKVKKDQEERTLLHARLIRDADKLDNCRVKLTESLEVLLGCSAQEAGSFPVTDRVYEQACAKESILSAYRKTPMDYWLSYLAHIFDINFLPTLEIIVKKNYIERTMERIAYTNPQTNERMRHLEKLLLEFAQENLKAAPADQLVRHFQ